MGLFRPKKDICDRCESFKTGNLEKKDYEDHIMRREESRLEKEKDKISYFYYGFASIVDVS